MNSIDKKSVLLTGVCGSVGEELLRGLLSGLYGEPASVTGLDNNESRLFFLQTEFQGDPRVSFCLADVRDAPELVRQFWDVDVVIHAAALKHVGICEQSPNQATLTNVIGVQNVIDAARETRVERVIFFRRMGAFLAEPR